MLNLQLKMILNIAYIDICEQELNVNPKISHFDRKMLIDIFYKYYVNPVRPTEPKTKYEMKIVVDPKHTPFYFRPRRLSFAGKKCT